MHSQKEGGKIGYVPGNYVEEVRDFTLCSTSSHRSPQVSANNEPTAAAAPSGLDLSKLVIPDSVRYSRSPCNFRIFISSFQATEASLHGPCRAGEPEQGKGTTWSGGDVVRIRGR